MTTTPEQLEDEAGRKAQEAYPHRNPYLEGGAYMGEERSRVPLREAYMKGYRAAFAEIRAAGLLVGAPTEEQTERVALVYLNLLRERIFGDPPRTSVDEAARAQEIRADARLLAAAAAGVAPQPKPRRPKHLINQLNRVADILDEYTFEDNASEAAGLMRRAAERLAGVAPQEPEWEHGVLGGDDLLARLMDTLAYYHCRSVNPKADSPYLGYHAMSEDQRGFLRERQREAAEEVLRMWRAEASPASSSDREKLIAEALDEASQRVTPDSYYGDETEEEAIAKAAGFNAAKEILEPYVRQLAALAAAAPVLDEAKADEARIPRELAEKLLAFAELSADGGYVSIVWHGGKEATLGPADFRRLSEALQGGGR